MLNQVRQMTNQMHFNVSLAPFHCLLIENTFKLDTFHVGVNLEMWKKRGKSHLLMDTSVLIVKICQANVRMDQ